MNSEWIKFLLIAVIVMAVCLGGIGGWLLPEFGLGPMPSRAIGGAIGGGIIAYLYQRMIGTRPVS